MPSMTLAQQENTITIPGRKRERRRLLRQFPGLISAVARQEKVGRSHVCRVFHNQSISDRISTALLRELTDRQARNQFPSNGAPEGNGKKAA